MGILSRRALDGLKQYQYKAGGYSRLEDLHQPFWNFLVEQLPLWLAPNLITLTGTVALVVAYAVAIYYSPNLEEHAPRWTYLLSAVSIQLYCHLDCIDGKQARRTKTSSPLGQLFDHGCDAISVHLLLANIATSLNVPCGWTAAAGIFGIMFPWMLAQWEEYHTGIMMYGNSWFGVLEANYAITLVHLVTFIFGPEMWGVPLQRFVDIPGLSMEGLAVRDVVLTIVFIGAMLQAFSFLHRTFTSDPTRMSDEEKGNKELGPWAAARHLMGICLMLALGAAWVGQPNRGWGQCRAVSSAWGFSFAFMASQLIIAHMCKEPFHPTLWTFIAMAAGLADSKLALLDPYLTSFALAAIIGAEYFFYVINVINEICKDLRIRCLTIPKPRPAPKED